MGGGLQDSGMGCRRQDPDDGRNQEKYGNIMQHCIIFFKRNNADHG